jgi:hypothetical protein
MTMTGIWMPYEIAPFIQVTDGIIAISPYCLAQSASITLCCQQASNGHKGVQMDKILNLGGSYDQVYMVSVA